MMRRWGLILCLLALATTAVAGQAPALTGQDGGAPLRVITFNVMHGNQRMSAVEVWLREQNADILLLQEVRTGPALEVLDHLTDLYPYRTAQEADVLNWGSFWGTFTLSRYPIIAADPAIVTSAGEPAYRRAVIDMSGQAVAVYNVHLLKPVSEEAGAGENPYLDVLGSLDPARRNAQIEALLAALAAETYPFIVGGDFNLDDGDDVYDQLAAVMTDSFADTGDGAGATWPNAGAIGLPPLLPPFLRLDYVWHSAQFLGVSAEVGGKLGSDHLPVVVTLEVQSG